jgi:hypothetical protein
MLDITLIFGKHHGKKFSQIPIEYVHWLSAQATICGGTEIPQAAKAYLATLPPEVANALRYSIPRTAEEAEKLAWMAGKGNTESARTLLAARNQQGYISVDFEDADGEEGFFYVYEHGTGGFFAGTQADIDEDAREDEENAKAQAERDAHPTLEWISQSGETIKVWEEYFDGDDQFVTVLVHGQKVEGFVMNVPVKQRAQAKVCGIVAVISTRLGNIGLTAERKATLDAFKEGR